MIAVEIDVAGRRARAFARDLQAIPSDPGGAEDAFWDDEDRRREPRLRVALQHSPVRAVAYPTEGHRDVLQVFLRSGAEDGDSLFACVVVGGNRLREMVEQAGWVLEGFSFQSAPVERLSAEGVRAALQAWVERCFPDIVPPGVVLELWTGPQGVPEDVLHMLLSGALPELPEAGLDQVEPDPALAEPAYDETA